MEPLTWTGSLGTILDPVLYAVAAFFVIALAIQIVLGIASGGARVVTNPDGTLSSASGPYGMSTAATKWIGLALVVLVLTYIVMGAITGPAMVGIIGGMSQQLLPVWIALIVTFVVSIKFKQIGRAHV